MPSSIALLRGINVSGKNKIFMADLKDLFINLGCESVATYLQSGNVVYQSTTAISAKDIQSAISKQFGLEVPVLILAADRLKTLIQNNPFLEDGANTAHCYVTFPWESPDEETASNGTLPANETGRFSLKDDLIYICCPDGYGRTKIHNLFFEKKLQLLATTRNWKTVNALLELSKQ
ncbi:DUF1697 domain-containing protein [Opitutia bacterium ISCC 51]|nr:DUF1697 domain-containing protein [Opitutae bacterium ISCC 51]QXD29956.1 DUF1697 domain-containing protein [Opitutae bacterium ISCC 52]